MSLALNVPLAPRSPRIVTSLAALLLLAAPAAHAQVSLTTLGTPYTQDFDTLPPSGSATWTNNGTIPGWFHARTGTGTTIVANDGSSNAGNLYSYGTGTATNRALGSLGSGNAAVGNLFWGVRLQNNTGATITSFDVTYFGEQWRNSAAAAQTIAFSYLVGSPTVTGSLAEFQSAGVAVTGLDFVSPITGGVAGALNGNVAPNRVQVTFSITGLSIPNGTEVMLRWSDPDHTGTDHGLSIDDFSVTPQGTGGNAPVVPTCPATLTTTQGTPTSGPISATDADGTVVSATITGITPVDPGTIAITGFTPAGGVGGTANGTLSVSNTTPAGSYSVTIQWANNDAVPQTANCVVAVTVNPPPVALFIHDVQGNGSATPIPPATPVTVEGVVIGRFQATGQLGGFFLQEEDADNDADPQTSEGLFIFCGGCPTAVAEGQRVQVTGLASEFFGMTELTATTAGSVVVTDPGNHLALVTPATIDLPVVGDVNAFYEAREGMRVTFVDSLSVSEYFEQARFGTLELFEGGRPMQFTQTTAPSIPGYAAHLENLTRRRVLLDDDNDNQNGSLLPFQPEGSQFNFFPRANGGLSVGTQGTDFFRGGDLVNGLTGVLHWSFSGLSGTDAWRIRPAATTPAAFTVSNPRPPSPPAVGGAIKGASMNLLNYFTTIDTTSGNSGPCGPSATQDCRGADSAAELSRQRTRTALVICGLNAHVFGLNELENTSLDAITDLLGAVNAICGGANPYVFVNTGGTSLGTDAIRVALVYRSGVLSPVGPALADLDPVHNRPPTAQTFDVVDAANPTFGQRFTVIANHFKSKSCSGATGGDLDAGDGQGCFTATRTAQANRLLTWINSTVVPAAGDPDVLLLGDFNSYPQEVPVSTLTSGGYTDLETALLGPAAYSYLFDGQLGHLDYAFASATLTPQIAGVGAWHINADESPLFDYSDEVKDVGEGAFEEKSDGSALVPPRVLFQPSSVYRAADHDPVLVGLFRVADLGVTKTDAPDPVVISTPLTYTITVTNNGPEAATGASWTDLLPTDTTFVSLSSAPGWSCTTPAVGAHGTVSCTNPSVSVGSTVFTLVVVPGPALAGMTISNTASADSAAFDPVSGNDSATTTTLVMVPVELMSFGVE